MYTSVTCDFARETRLVLLPESFPTKERGFIYGEERLFFNFRGGTFGEERIFGKRITPFYHQPI